MAKFKFDTPEEKVRLQARAQMLKPKVHNVVATALGWSQPRPNGTLELLVSFAGLDELLGDVSEDCTDPTPVEVTVVTVAEEAPAVELPEVVVPEIAPVVIEDEEDEPVVVAAPKKGGRPKRVAD